MRVGGSVVDTPEELNRSIEFLQYQQQIEVVQSWAEQNKLSAKTKQTLAYGSIFLFARHSSHRTCRHHRGPEERELQHLLEPRRAA